MSRRRRIRKATTKCLPSHRRRLIAEPLEARHLLAAFLVTNADDTGAGSLRMAIDQSNTSGGADTISFDANFFSTPRTIQLGSALPTVTGPLTINGPGADRLTIDAQGGSRIFRVDDALPAASTVVLADMTLTGGNVTGFGGAILSTEVLTVRRLHVTGNTASSRGGGIHAGAGTLDVFDSTFDSNSAIDSAAIAPEGAATRVINTTISGNMASGNGAVVSRNGSTLDVLHSTVVRNEMAGGAAVYRASGSGTVRIGHSIVAENTGGAGDVYGSIGMTSLGYNVIGVPGNQGGAFSQPGDQKNVSDAMLGSLANHGGPTPTHALLAGSAAIDTGDPTVSMPPSFDQRGAPFERIAGGRIDVGAYERQTLGPSLFVVTTSTDELDYSNSDVSLREAINSANGSVGADTITFDGNYFSTARTIRLGSALPTIASSMTISGPGASRLTLDADEKSRVLTIDDGDNAAASNVVIAGLTLTGGVAGDATATGFDRLGGGILSLENLTVADSIIRGNRAFLEGGGIFSGSASVAVTGTHLTVLRTTIADNGTGSTGDGFSGFGGGLMIRSGDATVTASTIDTNRAVFGGGAFVGLNSFSSSLTIAGSTIANNFATNEGGGLYNGSTLIVSGSTIAGNRAENNGGGIFGNGSARLTSTIVAGNRLFDNSLNDVQGSNLLTSSSFNLIGTGGSGGLTNGANNNQVGVDWTSVLANDGFSPLQAYNGGPTQTIALLPGSPALNMGSSVEANDQRGAPFVRSAGGGVDVGAYERQTLTGLSLVVDTAIDENDGDYTAGDLSLREAIGLANGSIGADTITFNSLFDSARTINLVRQLPTIVEALTITGPGQDLLTLDAGRGTDNLIGTGDGFRIFNLDDGNSGSKIDVSLSGLTLTGGDPNEDDSAARQRQLHHGFFGRRRRDLLCPWQFDDHQQHDQRQLHHGF